MKIVSGLFSAGLLLCNVLSAQTLTTDDIGVKVPSITGTGASGSWNINVTGAGQWSGQSFVGTGDNIGFYMLGHSSGSNWAAFTPDKVKIWLGLTATGETLQSVTDRGAITSAGKEVRFLSANGTTYTYVGGNNSFARIGAYDVNGGWQNLIINDGGGQVGIGTTTPTNTLDVNGGVNAHSESHFWQGVYADPHDGTAYAVKIGGGGIAVGGNAVFTNGNVGIGTTTPGNYKLAVEGIIGARKLKITAGSWADYVFDSSYELKPLDQVEKFIAENKHLPDVPTTEEIKKEGMDVGDNQALLLKKIEELTLYMIEQNKKLEVQNKQLEEQARQLAAQQKEMEAMKQTFIRQTPLK